MCKFNGSNLYLEPKKSNGYPSEIIDRRLYLGDSTHAKNETIIHNLGITHILNVTHEVPNTFEDSKTLNITYQRVSIKDDSDVPINLSFNIAYDFIEKAISKKKTGKMRFFSTMFGLVQNFSDSRKKSMVLVSSAAPTNKVHLDLTNKITEDVKDEMRDKIFDIDCICQYNMQNSNNQNRVLVHCAMGRSRSATMVIMYLMRKYQIEWSLAFDIVKHRREIVDPNEGFISKLKEYEGKQYKLRRLSMFKSTSKISEVDEFTDFSESENEGSGSSSEDLMEMQRTYSKEM